ARLRPLRRAPGARLHALACRAFPVDGRRALVSEAWPSLPLEAWSDTLATLHMWGQIVGKVRLRQTPWINPSWHVTLYVTPRGLTTSPIPHGTRAFSID